MEQKQIKNAHIVFFEIHFQFTFKHKFDKSYICVVIYNYFMLINEYNTF